MKIKNNRMNQQFPRLELPRYEIRMSDSDQKSKDNYDSHSDFIQSNTNACSSDDDDEDSLASQYKYMEKRKRSKLRNKITSTNRRIHVSVHSASPYTHSNVVLPWTEIASEISGCDEILDPGTYTIADPSELDYDTSSATIFLWSDEDNVDHTEASKMKTCNTLEIVDANQNQNIVKRPRSRCENVGRPTPLHGSLASSTLGLLDANDYNRTATLSQRSNPESEIVGYKEQPSRLTMSARYSSNKNAMSGDNGAGRWGLRIRAVKPNVPESRIQQDLRDEVHRARTLDQVTEENIETCITDDLKNRADFHAVIGHVPVFTDSLRLGVTRPLSSFRPKQQYLHRLFQFQDACTVQTPRTSGLVIPLMWNVLRSPSPTGEWAEEYSDTVNPNILSPVIENEFVNQVAPKCCEFDRNEPESKCTYLERPVSQERQSLKEVSFKPPILMHLPPESKCPETSELITTLGPRRKRFRRRVKISLHECPPPSESESHSLVVRLRIDPLLDSESVRSQSVEPSESQTASVRTSHSVSPKLKSTPRTFVRYDSVEPCKTKSWIPINCYIRTLNSCHDVKSNEIDKYTGIAECLITSLSSLSIPVSEVESIDTSFSWSLPDTGAFHCKSGTKATNTPDAVIVEVPGEENAKKTEQPSSVGSDSGICYVRTTKTPSDHCTKREKIATCDKCTKFITNDSPVNAYCSRRTVPMCVENSQDGDVHRNPVTKSSALNSEPPCKRHARCYVTHTHATGKTCSRILSSCVPDEKHVTNPGDTQSKYELCESTIYTRMDEHECYSSDAQVASLAVDPERGEAEDMTTLSMCSQHMAARVYNRFNPSRVQLQGITSEINNIPLTSNGLIGDMKESDGTQTDCTTVPVDSSKKTSKVNISRLRQLRIPTFGAHGTSNKPIKNEDISIPKPLTKSGLYSATEKKIAVAKIQENSGLVRPINAHTIGSTFYARSSLPRKKPLFRSGEMTISEFEELQKRVALGIPNSKSGQSRLARAISSSRAVDLGSVANELDVDPMERFKVRNKSSKFTFCVRRQHSRESSVLSWYQPHETPYDTFKIRRTPHDSTRGQARFGFSMNPNLQNPGAVKVAIGSERKKSEILNETACLSTQKCINVPRTHPQFDQITHNNSNSSTSSLCLQHHRLFHPLLRRRARCGRVSHSCRVICAPDNPSDSMREQSTPCSSQTCQSPIQLTVLHFITPTDLFDRNYTLSQNTQSNICLFDEIKTTWFVKRTRVRSMGLREQTLCSGLYTSVFLLPYAHYCNMIQKPTVLNMFYSYCYLVEQCTTKLDEVTSATRPTFSLSGVCVPNSRAANQLSYLHAQCQSVSRGLFVLLFNNCGPPFVARSGQSLEYFVPISLRFTAYSVSTITCFCNVHIRYRYALPNVIDQHCANSNIVHIPKCAWARQILLQQEHFSVHNIVEHGRFVLHSKKPITVNRKSMSTIKAMQKLLNSIFKPRTHLGKWSLRKQGNPIDVASPNKNSFLRTESDSRITSIQYKMQTQNQSWDSILPIDPVRASKASTSEVVCGPDQLYNCYQDNNHHDAGTVASAGAQMMCDSKKICTFLWSMLLDYSGHDRFRVRKAGCERNPRLYQTHRSRGSTEHPPWIRKRCGRLQAPHRSHSLNVTDLESGIAAKLELRQACMGYVKPLVNNFTEVTVFQSSPSLYLNVQEVANRDMVKWDDAKYAEPNSGEMTQVEEGLRASRKTMDSVQCFGDVKSVGYDGLRATPLSKSTESGDMQRTRSRLQLKEDSVFLESSVDLTVSISTDVTSSTNTSSITQTDSKTDLDYEDDDEEGQSIDFDYGSQVNTGLRRLNSSCFNSSNCVSLFTETTQQSRKSLKNGRKDVEKHQRLKSTNEDEEVNPTANVKEHNHQPKDHTDCNTFQRPKDPTVAKMNGKTRSKSWVTHSAEESLEIPKKNQHEQTVRPKQQERKYSTQKSIMYVEISDCNETHLTVSDPRHAQINWPQGTEHSQGPRDQTSFSTSFEKRPVLLRCCYRQN